jgi:hypothetical protein
MMFWHSTAKFCVFLSFLSAHSNANIPLNP